MLYYREWSKTIVLKLDVLILTFGDVTKLLKFFDDQLPNSFECEFKCECCFNGLKLEVSTSHIVPNILSEPKMRFLCS